MMGFNLTQQKLQMVLTILGVGCLLQPGKTIPLVQLKTAILDKNLENHHEKTEWMSRGGGGKLKTSYTQRSSDNRGDPAFEKLRILEEQRQRDHHESTKKTEITMSDNLRTMLHKLADRFSTVRRAFRTVDADKSGEGERSRRYCRLFVLSHTLTIPFTRFPHTFGDEVSPQHNVYGCGGERVRRVDGLLGF